MLAVSKSDNGVFWVSYEDFCKNFTNFELGSAIEHLSSDTASKFGAVILVTQSAGKLRSFNVVRTTSAVDLGGGGRWV